MFLQKINQLATDWGKSNGELHDVARESLLYGMRLTRYPSMLKRELRRVRIDSLIAKPLWSGNAYLLLELPEVLTNKRKKIPCLADFHFARKNLSKKQLVELKKQVKMKCSIPREELFRELMVNIKNLSWRGRFLPQHDGMYENLKDIESDLAIRAMEIINREFSNFRNQNREQIVAYLGYCLKSKYDTFLKQESPKMLKARIEPEDFDRIVHDKLAGEESNMEHVDLDFKEDLKKMLQPKIYRGVAILLGFEDIIDQRGFAKYLKDKSLELRNLNQSQFKSHIEKYLGVPVFEKAMQNDKLKQFLLGRINVEQGE
jgi:hypothetical protein